MERTQSNHAKSQLTTCLKNRSGQENPDPRHGRVITPASRAVIYLEEWIANSLESGKFFPARVAGLTDPKAPDDVKNATPPLDGQIASAGVANAAEIDGIRDWYTHAAKSGQTINVQWAFSAPHITRRYNYFITRSHWNRHQVLSRDQFEANPFIIFEDPCQPHWNCSPPTQGATHHFTLPVRSGYHVILAVWEIANTGNAFYQVIDFNFE